MYEVEVMLGETDPSHIIRSIEYWDNEKRKYPQRQHFAVLIAESFDYLNSKKCYICPDFKTKVIY